MKLINENVENYIHGQHIFETPDDIYINGQGYDKNTMEFKPFVFFNTDKAFAKKNLLLHQIDNITYDKDWYDQDYCRYLQDNQDPNIFYYVSEIAYDNKNQYINKVEKINDTWKITKSISPDDTFTYGGNVEVGNKTYQILGQTKDYIIVFQSKLRTYTDATYLRGDSYGATRPFSGFIDGRNMDWNGPDNNAYMPVPIVDSCTIYAINKNTFTVQSNKIGGYPDVYVKSIIETKESVYLYINTINWICIWQYKPDSNLLNKLLTYHVKEYNDNCPDYTLIGCSNIININDSFYCLTGNQNKYYFLKFNIDVKNNKIDFTQIDINDNKMPLHNMFTMIDSTSKISSKIYYNLMNLNNYICIVTYTSFQSYTYYNHNVYGYINYGAGAFFFTNDYSPAYQASPIEWEIIALLKLNNDNTIDCLESFHDINRQRCRGVLQKNQNQIFILYQDALEGYIIQDNKLYNNFELLGNEQQIGFDELKRLYVIDQNSKIKILDDPISYYVNASFEKSDYTYDNKEIQTYITINSKNYLNKNIKSKVQITLDGPCKFTSNGLKKITTYTSATEDVKIPVTVTYGGTVNCYIKEVQ